MTRSPINDEDMEISITIQEYVDTSYKRFLITLRGQLNMKLQI